MSPRPHAAPQQGATSGRSHAAERGLVAALQGPVRDAERALDAGDYAGAARLLRPSMREIAATLGGRSFELWARCGAEGAAAIDVRRALNQALHAYQDGHDVAGMARCHADLGELCFGRGELDAAGREFGYANHLFARHGTVQQRVAILGRLASAALHRGEAAQGLADADAALQLCRSLAAPLAVEAEARLVRAQALAALGQPQGAARELLWAERLMASDRAAQADPGPTLARAEGLLAAGHPRRAASVLRPLQRAASAPHGLSPQRQAHALRLEGEAALADTPASAATTLDRAQQRFAALGQPYYRITCELALARALHRAGAPDAHARLDALAAARLQRWPRLAATLAHAQAELERPNAHVPGAVRAPWTQAIGHHTGRVQVDEAPGQPAHEEAHAGLLGRLQSVLGRLRNNSRAS